jgi:1,2-diacylglycerol 3-alpha-glucosyltransferase
MKIAIFSDTFLPQVNGVASHIDSLAKMLQENNEVWVITASKNIPEDPNRKYKVILLPSLPALVYKGERLAILTGKGYRLMKKFGPDIIHTHTPFAVGIEAMFAAKILGIPIVGTHHTFYDFYLEHVKLNYNWFKNISWKLVCFYYNFCDLALAPSQISANEFIKNGITKPMEMLPYAIDTVLFHPVDPLRRAKLKEKFGLRSKSIVYMGRLSYEKSLDILLEAFSLVARKRPNTQLMIIGDGPERNNLNKLTKRMIIQEKVIFTGFLKGEDLVLATQANDIFATPSKTETFGISVMEGMAAGLPVVAANARSFTEIISDRTDGLLVEPDNFEDMAEKILQLLENSTLLEQYSKAARKKSLEYSEDKILEKINSYYDCVLKSKNDHRKKG